MATIDRHDEDFDDRNAFLQVLLGVLSLCRGFADVAVTLGPAAGASTPPDAVRSDSVLDAMVGLASLVHRTASQIEAAAPERGPLPPVPVDAGHDAPSLRSLLA